MRELRPTQTRIFRRKRRLGLKHVAIAIGFTGVILSGIALYGGSQTADISYTTADARYLPAKTAVAQLEPISAVRKHPFTAPAVKNEAVINKIQTKIGTLLEAGSNMFVSKKKLFIGKGDTLMNLLVKNNLSQQEAHDAIAALSKVYNPRDLNPNHEITVFFHQDPKTADPTFSGLQIEKDTINTVILNRKDDGSFKASKEEKETHRTVQAFRGKIDGSLYASAKTQGVPDGVILDLIKMFSHNVDFQRDLQSGDTFEVFFEDYVTDEGENAPGKGNIVYAKLDLGDRVIPLYRYKDKSGDVNTYDEKGQTGKKALMRTPIDGARLSSGFGMRRHPVLGYSKKHMGVDFAAPRGTPIYAAGDGLVEKVGPFTSYGNYVKIRHKSGLETAYAHMSGFKAGLRAGARVKQGQVIGYVGTTGRSTGPHLHYEVLLAGKQVNPATFKGAAGGNNLGGKELASFKAFVGQTKRQFNDLKSGGTALVDNVAKSKKLAKR